MKLIKNLCLMTLMLCSTAQAAALSQWIIDPKQSSISFTGTQNNAPVTGVFKSFSGTIYADLAQYQESNINIVINMDSVSVTYAELATILITPEWFNVKAFPKAEFKSSKFNKINDKTYEAIGVLTIKDKSVPTTLTFTATEPSKDHLAVEGRTILKRSAFNVGIGEWASTDVVKDEVTVNFKIVAARKA